MELKRMKEEAADLIVEAVKFATVAGVNASDCGIALTASLFLNIRDAMFHYKALCDSAETDEENCIKQYYNLKEHLLRGKKDAVILQAHTVCDAVRSMMQQKNYQEKFSPEELKQVKKLVHAVKDVILRIRIAGTELSEDTTFSIEEVWEEVVSCTIEITELCKAKDVPLF